MNTRILFVIKTIILLLGLLLLFGAGSHYAFFCSSMIAWEPSLTICQIDAILRGLLASVYLLITGAYSKKFIIYVFLSALLVIATAEWVRNGMGMQTAFNVLYSYLWVLMGVFTGVSLNNKYAIILLVSLLLGLLFYLTEDVLLFFKSMLLLSVIFSSGFLYRYLKYQ